MKGKIIFILHEIRIVGKLTVFTYPRKNAEKACLYSFQGKKTARKCIIASILTT